MATGILYNVPTEDSLHVLKASKLRSITELFRYVVFGDGLSLGLALGLGLRLRFWIC